MRLKQGDEDGTGRGNSSLESVYCNRKYSSRSNLKYSKESCPEMSISGQLYARAIQPIIPEFLQGMSGTLDIICLGRYV